MPEFEYQAKDGPQKQVRGVIEASDETSALEKISALGYAPVRLRQRSRLDHEARDIRRIFGSRLSSDREIIHFSRHLAGFLKNHVPVLKALEILRDQESNSSFKSILISLHAELKGGASLSASLDKYPQHFPALYVAMVRAGEKGSALQETLLILADYYKKHQRMKVAVRQALAYPVVLLIAGAVTVFFVVSFVVPKLTMLFENTQQDLNFLTRGVIALGNFMRYGWIAVLIAAVVLFWGLPRSLKKRMGAVNWDAMLMRLPWVGQVLFKADFARFCRALQMSLANGIPFLQALEAAIPTMKHENLRSAMRKAGEDVRKGGYFGHSIKRDAGIPAFAADLILVGEQSGNLDDILLEISKSYEEEVDDEIKTLTSLLEPLMILAVGAVVAVIVMAMLLPIFEMNTLVQ